ncbi:MAG TPA: alpha/beta fold hydrolase [Anaerolineales bacterium]|nr:alpha/beta fold hydrolase [Anaerolineales bacterium]
MLFAEEHGGGSTGPPLVLIHGAGGNRLVWPSALRRLSGAHVFAVDLPGHGKSPPILDVRIESYADHLEAWRVGAGVGPVVLAGHSMGAAVALTVALQAPSGVAGLALIGSGPSLPVNPALLERTAQETTFTSAVEDILAWSFAPEASSRWIDLVRTRMIESGPAQLHADLAACNAFDLTNRLGEIAAPSLVVVGSNDRMVRPRQAEALQAGLPRARLATVEGSGHMVMLEDPAAVTELLRAFLTEIAAA